MLFDGDTEFGHYQVVDTIYSGRAARVLYSGNRMAAQSGIAKDGNPRLLFDYIEQLFEFVLAVRPKRLLLIGGGVCTLPHALLKADPTVQIDVVELDRGLDKLARTYFDITDDPRLEIFYEDGRSYLARTDRTYDIVLVDTFSHTDIPKEMMTDEAAAAMHRVLADDGVVLVNIISPYLGRGNTIIRHQFAAYRQHFPLVTVHRVNSYDSLWLPLNLLLLAQKIPCQLEYQLSHGPLENLDTDEKDLLVDAAL